MKRFLLISLLVGFSMNLSAQTIANWSKWFDGNDLYVVSTLTNGDLIFNPSGLVEGNHYFSLRKVDNIPGEYILVPHNYTDDAPFRAQYGWRVQYIRKEGMYFLRVLNNFDETVWILVLTPDSYESCKGQLQDAFTRDADWMLSNYLMSTTYISRFSKDRLREMISTLQKISPRSIIEETNLSLIKSELKVVESQRTLLNPTK